MKICFVRHGPAVPSGTKGIADDARPLTAEGRAKTRAAMRGLRKLRLGITEIWTSPLPRARETAEILGRELKLKPRLSEALKPGAPVLLLARSRKRGCAALVGHEPDLGRAVAALVGGRTGAFPLKKAGVALVEDGELRLFLAPSTLRSL